MYTVLCLCCVCVVIGPSCVHCVVSVLCVQEVSDESVREELIREHFTKRILQVKAEVLYTATTP